MDLHRLATLASVVAAFAALGPWATIEDRGITVFEPPEVATYVVLGASGVGWVVVAVAAVAIAFGLAAHGTARDAGVGGAMLAAGAFVVFQLATGFFYSNAGSVFGHVVAVGWGAAGALLGSAVAVGAVLAARLRADGTPPVVEA